MCNHNYSTCFTWRSSGMLRSVLWYYKVSEQLVGNIFITNWRCVTSQKSKNLTFTAAEALNHYCITFISILYFISNIRKYLPELSMSIVLLDMCKTWTYFQKWLLSQLHMCINLRSDFWIKYYTLISINSIDFIITNSIIIIIIIIINNNNNNNNNKVNLFKI
jgi:hypothetical protein